MPTRTGEREVFKLTFRETLEYFRWTKTRYVEGKRWAFLFYTRVYRRTPLHYWMCVGAEHYIRAVYRARKARNAAH